MAPTNVRMWSDILCLRGATLGHGCLWDRTQARYGKAAIRPMFEGFRRHPRGTSYKAFRRESRVRELRPYRKKVSQYCYIIQGFVAFPGYAYAVRRDEESRSASTPCFYRPLQLLQDLRAVFILWRQTECDVW